MKEKFVVIIDGGGANFMSVIAAFDRLKVKSEVSCDPNLIKDADAVILPGVGAAGYAMKQLKNKNLIECLVALRQPVLGICLGQQLLCAFSEEDNINCLNIMPMRVTKFEHTRVIPHMGWNNLINLSENDPLFEGLSTKDNFYFSHSFAPKINKVYTIGACDYGINFSAVIKKENFYGVQFHPEKSGEAGMKVLKNFLKIAKFQGET
jgi:glutamine amidotransferase